MRFSNDIRQALLSLAFFLMVTGSATAGTLFGTVTKIQDGDTISLVCLKRPLQVRLMGIDAPEKDQAYAEAARQHLSDLILNKVVVVEYTGLGDNALIFGKVFQKETDVGAQMIRDGVAWYSKSFDGMLSENERKVYAECETAARGEKRGIWQDPNPVPPWTFKENQKLPEIPKVSPSVQTPPVVQTRKKSGLTNENLSPSFASAGAISLGSSEAVQVGSDSRWTKLAHPHSKVSVLVPGDGNKRSTKVLLEDGRVIDLDTYLGRFDKTTYVVVTSTGPDAKETDSEILDGAMRGFIGGIQSDFQKSGTTFDCYPDLDRNFSIGGFAGRQYDLSGCTVPGTVRFYTRVANNVRELYLTAAFFHGSADDPNASRFLDSFVVSEPRSSSRSKSSPAPPKGFSNQKKS